MNNPISQIERLKDAYMGRPQELQKRANVTKELVDLLAMQQLKKDIDAVKRDQMMQAQGNPATIKDQMQQGLMGEYRQQAAKEMGVGPSEADTVARAQQGMPRGMPQQQARMPQQQARMPQQQARMPQGVMSQARPVQLAGGGIVAFSEGGPTEEEIAEFLREGAEERRGREAGLSSLQLAEQTPAQATMARILERQANRPSIRGTKQEIMERRREEAIQPQLEEMFSSKPAAQDELEAAAKANEAARVRSTAPAEETTVAPAPTKTQPAGLAAVAQTPASAPEQTEIQKLLMETQRRRLNLDPEAAGAARAAMIRKELGLDEGLAALEERKARREQAFQSMQPTRMQRLQELFTAGGIGGIGAIGTRAAQQRQEAVDRRMAYENKLDEIENTSMELRRNIGTTAANEYSKAATRDLQTINNAAVVLQRMDVEDRQRFESELTRKRQDAQLEINRTNAAANLLGTTKDHSQKVTDIQKAITDISNRIREPYEVRRALLEQRAAGGDEQAKKDLDTLDGRIALEIMEDPNYIYVTELQEAAKREIEAAKRQRSGLLAGLESIQGANISSAGESSLAAVEGR